MECQGRGVLSEYMILSLTRPYKLQFARLAGQLTEGDRLFIIEVKVVKNARKLGNDLTRETVDVCLYAILFEYSAYNPMVFT